MTPDNRHSTQSPYFTVRKQSVNSIIIASDRLTLADSGYRGAMPRKVRRAFCSAKAHFMRNWPTAQIVHMQKISASEALVNCQLLLCPQTRYRLVPWLTMWSPNFDPIDPLEQTGRLLTLVCEVVMPVSHRPTSRDGRREMYSVT